MPYDNDFNRHVASTVASIDKRFLKNAESEVMAPYFSPIGGFQIRGRDNFTGFNEIYGGRVDETEAPDGLEGAGFWENISNMLQHDIRQNDKPSRIARDMAKGKTKEDIEKMIYNIKDIHDKEQLMGSGVGDFLGKVMSFLGKAVSSGKAFGKSASKTFLNPSDLGKQDLMNLYTLGTSEGFKTKKGGCNCDEMLPPKKSKKTTKSKSKSKEGAGLIDDVVDIIGLGKKKKENPDKKKLVKYFENLFKEKPNKKKMKGKGLIDDAMDEISDVIGLGKGAKVYKKKGSALHLQPEKKTKKKGGNMSQNPRKIGGDLVPQDKMPPSQMAGFGKKLSWKETIQKVKKENPHLKGLKEIIAFIKDNDLWKK